MEQCPVCYERDAKYKVCKNKHKLCIECYEKIYKDNKTCPYCRSKLWTVKTCKPNLYNKPVFKKRISFAKKLNIFIKQRHFLYTTNKYNDFKKYHDLFMYHFKDNYIISTYFSERYKFNPIIIPKDPHDILKMEKILYSYKNSNETKIKICSVLYENFCDTEKYETKFIYFFGRHYTTFNNFINASTFHTSELLPYIIYSLISHFKEIYT